MVSVSVVTLLYTPELVNGVNVAPPLVLPSHSTVGVGKPTAAAVNVAVWLATMV